MEPEQRPLYGADAGSRTLCKIVVNRQFDRATKILEVSPSLINLPHPNGWFPIHAVILCGDPSFVKFVLRLPGVDLTKKDTSSFKENSSKDGLLHRQKELCPDLAGTFNTNGATALHFACMRADLEILNLILEMRVDHYIKDNASRTPRDYFDYEHVDIEVLQRYEEALRTWHLRWRSRVKKDANMLCSAIRQQDYEHCKEILEAKPELARGRHRTMMRRVQLTLDSDRPAGVPEHFLRPKKKVRQTWNHDNSDSEDDSECESDGPTERRARTPASTALHYASLLGDLRAVELLLRSGADWSVVDDYGQRAADYAALSMDENRLQKFKTLCDNHKPKPSQDDGKSKDKAKRQNSGSTTNDTDHSSSSSSDSETSSEGEVGATGAKSGTEDELNNRHLKIEEIISDQMIGQRGPIRSIASAIRLRANGWVDPDRPLVMLFLGSSGVGKTELAKRVAYYLHEHLNDHEKSDESPKVDKPTTSFGQSLVEIEKAGMFTRIDMSEYQHKHTVSNLTGSPKGYVGYGEGGVLTKSLKKNPKAIILLDEIEKAHPDVLTVFLQLFDDGRITDPSTGTVHCPGAVFIMTSNLGSEEIKAAAPELQSLVSRTENKQEVYLQGIRDFTRGLYPELKAALKRDEFIGRINQTVVFLPFEHAEIAQMIERELTKWKKRAHEQHGIQLTWSPEVVNRLAGGYDVNYGARSVINETQRLAVHLLAEAQIRGDIGKNWFAHIYINVKGDIDMLKQNPRARLLPRGCHFHCF